MSKDVVYNRFLILFIVAITLFVFAFAGSYAAIYFVGQEINILQVAVASVEIPALEPVSTMTGLTVAAYHAGPAEGWGDGCVTKDGTNICDGTWPKDKWLCAASPDVLKKFPFGTTIELSTLSGFWKGRCEMHDQTNTRFRKRIDILIPTGHKGHVYPLTTAKEITE